MLIGMVTVCLFVCVCVFVRLRISSARIKLAASNFARWFIGFMGRESPILGNFTPPEAQNLTNRRARIGTCRYTSVCFTGGERAVRGTYGGSGVWT